MTELRIGGVGDDESTARSSAAMAAGATVPEAAERRGTAAFPWRPEEPS